MGSKQTKRVSPCISLQPAPRGRTYPEPWVSADNFRAHILNSKCSQDNFCAHILNSKYSQDNFRAHILNSKDSQDNFRAHILILNNFRAYFLNP